MNPRLALAATTVAALVGSLTGTAAAHPARRASHPIVFDHHDSGRAISVTRGTTFKVSLEACGDCGQYWSFAHRPAGATLKVEKKLVKPDAKPPAVGGNDHTIWTFRGVGKGRTTMRIVERSAENRQKIIKHFTLTVGVA
ncbi:MAG TPA: protease inhibitor I42 family protein [Mycobacteriales bacterium]|nr:protease inhibitor I42 family protein [Mycobacteriales bacterium]